MCLLQHLYCLLSQDFTCIPILPFQTTMHVWSDNTDLFYLFFNWRHATNGSFVVLCSGRVLEGVCSEEYTVQQIVCPHACGLQLFKNWSRLDDRLLCVQALLTSTFRVSSCKRSVTFFQIEFHCSTTSCLVWMQQYLCISKMYWNNSQKHNGCPIFVG